MAILKKDATYYVGKPTKKGLIYAQKTVYVDKDGKKHISDTHSRKASDFKGGFMGFGVSQKAIVVSQNAFDKLK